MWLTFLTVFYLKQIFPRICCRIQTLPVTPRVKIKISSDVLTASVDTKELVRVWIIQAVGSMSFNAQMEPAQKVSWSVRVLETAQ